jgi:hypothetical protein
MHELGKVFDKALLAQKQIDAVCYLCMGDVIDVELVVLFEV